MSRAHCLLVSVCGLASIGVLAGCDPGAIPATPPWVSNSVFKMPPELRAVLDRPADFMPASDDPLQTTAPGTVLDDLSALDGCWGAYYAAIEGVAGFGLVDVIHLDHAQGRFTRSVAAAMQAGGFWPEQPGVATEFGSFRVTSPSTVLLVTERIAYADLSSSASAAGAEEGTVDLPNAVERPALVTLQGDRMLFYLDVEQPGEVDQEEPRPIYRRFDCPAPE